MNQGRRGRERASPMRGIVCIVADLKLRLPVECTHHATL